MANECFRVRGEGQSKVLIFRSTCKPLLLFRHYLGVRAEKSKSVQSGREYVIIRFSGLFFVDDLPRFVKTLQGKGIIGEILVQSYFFRCQVDALPRDLHGIFISPLCGEYYAQIVIRRNFTRVATNLFLISLGCFVQFSSYGRIIVGSDRQSFPFAGTLAQLKCFGKVLAGSRWLAEIVVVNAHCAVGHRKGSSSMAR